MKKAIFTRVKKMTQSRIVESLSMMIVMAIATPSSLAGPVNSSPRKPILMTIKKKNKWR